MNVFYNRQGIGDTLILALGDVSQEDRSFEKKGDVVRIYDQKTRQTVGYNLFNASTYGEIDGHGPIEATDEILNLIHTIFDENGVEEKLQADLSPKFVVGFVEEKEKHPNADKLSVCQVNVGDQTLQIVCGAPNVEAGQKVVVALEGAVMPSGLVIKKTVLRGVDSTGMICSAKELNLANAPQEKGILVLEEDRVIGEAFLLN
ncbi:YtpR family tRNA-binding protein [Halalkalibacterium ligniniphilum]|uniref:YtpR family tRNA-binding protein n=1 Tax=Halalkalibacterium ligniniphilum TaxID=1134413 RepID=UPI0003486F34|nr:DUF4479 family protein [Halalkalibacterium ligniniphilum]